MAPKTNCRNKSLIYIEENPQISTSEIAIKLGVGVRIVKRRIKQMTNIVYVINGYSGHWEIKG